MTEKERSLIIPDITEGEPEVRKLMPDVGEEPVRQTYAEDWGGHRDKLNLISMKKPLVLSPEGLSALLKAIASYGEGEQEIQEVGELDIDSD